MRTALFWAVTQRVVVIPCLHFGTSPSHIQVIKMERVGCPETSVKKYHFSLRNSQEDCSSHLLNTWFQCIYSYTGNNRNWIQGTHNIIVFLCVISSNTHMKHCV